MFLNRARLPYAQNNALILLAMLSLSAGMWGSSLAALEEEDGRGCPAALSAISLRVHIVQREGQPAVNPAWIDRQIAEANSRFLKIGLCFQRMALQSLPQQFWRIRNRRMRNKVGLSRIQRGLIDLFVVGRLDDIDRAGEEIRGVHWRHRSDRRRKRWIFLSKIAGPRVLAHELGHYFDLPHSRAAESIMNKQPRRTPPPADRGFTRQEYGKMSSAWRRMRRSGHLRERARSQEID